MVMHTLTSALREVFGRPPYLVLALVIFILLMLLAIWLPNFSLVANTISSPTLAFGQKLHILAGTLGALETNFTAFTRATTILIAVLFGVNVSMVVFYLKRRISTQRSAGIGLAGILSGLVGVGCAACGSVILSALVGIGAAAGIVGALPLHGQEFSLFSIAILIVAIVIVARHITNPLVCRID